MWINEATKGIFTLHAEIRYECWRLNIELPGILTDEVLAQFGYAPVKKVIPVYDPIYKEVKPLAPVQNEQGEWELPYEVVDLDPTVVANNLDMLKIRSVSMAQARLQLIKLGLYETVNNAISSMSLEAQVDWEYRTSVDRSFPLVAQMQQLLGWTDAEMDTYFTEAAKL